MMIPWILGEQVVHIALARLVTSVLAHSLNMQHLRTIFRRELEDDDLNADCLRFHFDVLGVLCSLRIVVLRVLGTEKASRSFQERQTIVHSV